MKLLTDISQVDFSKGNVLVQAKADGEFTVLYYYRSEKNLSSVDEYLESFIGETHTINRYGNIRRDFPALHEFVALMHKNMPNIRYAKILCELYARDPRTNRPLRLPEYIHNMKSEGGSKVHIGIWGLIEPLLVTLPPPTYKTTLESLEKLVQGGKLVEVLPWIIVGSPSGLKAIWDRHIKFGWEGLVIRQDDDIYKIKPEHDCDCVIVGINKKDGKLLSRGEVGSVRLALMTPDKIFIEVGSAGGFTHEMRRDLYRELMPLKVVEDKKTIWVEPIVIVEIKYTEIFKVKPHKNARNYNLKLKYNPFEIIGKVNFVRFRHPRFSRLRGDKTVCPDDLRLSQVAIEPASEVIK